MINMKLVLRDTRTDEIIAELMDNLEEELTDEEIQNLIEGYVYDEEDLQYVYISYED